jgi:hypothetical protein
MKPKYIFTAVFAVCILMVTVLPQLGGGRHTAAAKAPAEVANAVNRPFVAPTLTVTATQPAVDPQVVTPKAEPQAALAGEPLPSPADPSAQAGAVAAVIPAAIPATSSDTDLASFVTSVSNGQASQVTGVYVAGLFSMPIVQQPAGDVNYVSTTDQVATEYSRSSIYGVVGLLAHNTLTSGQSFYKLKPGQEVILVYGDGRQAHYKVARVENYQALSPNDPFSDFIDLNGPGGQLVHNEDLFRRIYTTTGELVFQTCFEANGDPSWGRMFVIANPS